MKEEEDFQKMAQAEQAINQQNQVEVIQNHHLMMEEEKEDHPLHLRKLETL